MSIAFAAASSQYLSLGSDPLGSSSGFISLRFKTTSLLTVRGLWTLFASGSSDFISGEVSSGFGRTVQISTGDGSSTNTRVSADQYIADVWHTYQAHWTSSNIYVRVQRITDTTINSWSTPGIALSISGLDTFRIGDGVGGGVYMQGEITEVFLASGTGWDNPNLGQGKVANALALGGSGLFHLGYADAGYWPLWNTSYLSSEFGAKNALTANNSPTDSADHFPFNPYGRGMKIVVPAAAGAAAVKRFPIGVLAHP